MKPRATGGLVLAGLAALAIVPYLRTVTLPFISDDYVQIWLGRHFAPLDRWPLLAEDALYRCRATSILITYWTERVFGLHPLAFTLTSLLLHVANTWLVFGLGFWRPIGWRLAAAAAGFFAIYEGHQEAVVWYAALPELLVFFFSLSALLLWILWLERGRAWYCAGSFAAFLLALGSKEPAVAVTGLMLLPVWTGRVPWRRWVAPWAAFAAAAVIYTGMVFAGSSGHLHFHDGTFSLSGPVALVMMNSTGRMLWFWGALSILALIAWRERGALRLGALAAAWAAIAFLPYSFLTYMPRVPSRHTYFASVALAWVVGAALLAFRSRVRPRWAVAALGAAMVLHNAGYIWTRKYEQFLERARPTEDLIAFMRHAHDPVYVHCFPYPVIVAEWAAEMRLGRKVVDASAAGEAHGAIFCATRPPHAGMAAVAGQ